MKDEPPDAPAPPEAAYPPLQPMSKPSKPGKSGASGPKSANDGKGAKDPNGAKGPSGPSGKKPGKASYIPPNTARVLASTLGCLPASMLTSAMLARFLPLPSPVSVSLAYLLWLPIWIAAACWAARATSGKRAWLFVAIFTAIPAALLFLVPH